MCEKSFAPGVPTDNFQLTIEYEATVKIDKISSGLAAATVVGRGTQVGKAPTALQGLRVELGVIRLFGKGDIAGRGLLTGWATPEEGHNWNDGLDTSFLVEASLPTSPVTVAAEGVPYIFGDTNRQEITLFANGYRVGFWRLTERRQATLTAKIEPEQWFSRRGLGYLNLTWHLPGSARPSDLGDGADGRILGFAFRTFCLSEVSED
jgi:hypothetical protein